MTPEVVSTLAFMLNSATGVALNRVLIESEADIDITRVFVLSRLEDEDSVRDENAIRFLKRHQNRKITLTIS